MRDIYNGPHLNHASQDRLTNLWDSQLATPHFYCFPTTFVCSPIKIGRSEKQRACCCSTFIPVHSLHSLFVFDYKNWKGLFCPEIHLNIQQKKKWKLFFSKKPCDQVPLFLFCQLSWNSSWRRLSAGIDDWSAVSSLARIANQSRAITQQSCAGLAVTYSFSVKLFAWKLLCTSTASFKGASFQI